MAQTCCGFSARLLPSLRPAFGEALLAPGSYSECPIVFLLLAMLAEEEIGIQSGTMGGPITAWLLSGRAPGKGGHYLALQLHYYRNLLGWNGPRHRMCQNEVAQ